jgi:hypothetical protein
MPCDQMSVDVIVKLAPAAIVRESSTHGAVQACAAGLGIALEPLHPSTSDPELSSYFIAHVEPTAVNTVVERLLGCDGVEGAYPKPKGEPPRGG